MPKFYSAEFITEFQLLTNFIGCLYSAVVTVRPELSAFHELAKFSKCGPCRESLVWSLVDSKILRNESIICIFNAERNFQGLLLNYVSEKNHACFEGRLSLAACHKYGFKIVEIYLPFLYLLCNPPLTKVCSSPRKPKGKSSSGCKQTAGCKRRQRTWSGRSCLTLPSSVCCSWSLRKTAKPTQSYSYCSFSRSAATASLSLPSTTSTTAQKNTVTST